MNIYSTSLENRSHRAQESGQTNYPNPKSVLPQIKDRQVLAQNCTQSQRYPDKEWCQGYIYIYRLFVAGWAICLKLGSLPSCKILDTTDSYLMRCTYIYIYIDSYIKNLLFVIPAKPMGWFG